MQDRRILFGTVLSLVILILIGFSLTTRADGVSTFFDTGLHATTMTT